MEALQGGRVGRGRSLSKTQNRLAIETFLVRLHRDFVKLKRWQERCSILIWSITYCSWKLWRMECCERALVWWCKQRWKENTCFCRDCKFHLSPAFLLSGVLALFTFPFSLILKNAFSCNVQLLERGFQNWYLTDIFSRLIQTSRWRNDCNPDYCFSSHWQGIFIYPVFFDS